MPKTLFRPQSLVLILSLALSPFLMKSVEAKQYPWVPVSESDIQVIRSNSLEAPLRIRLIQEAKERIDIIVYDQRSDEVHALPLLVALREAADRGVRIRFLTNWLSRALGDSDAIAPKLLTTPRPKGIVEYYMVGGFPAISAGWLAADAIHEKLLIIDGKVLLTTGRGFGGPYDHWLDTAYLIRGNLVSQAQTAFNEVYSVVKRNFEKFRPQGPLGEKKRARLMETGKNALLENSLTPEGSRAVELLQWGFEPPACASPEGEGCGPTVRGRLLHNEVIHQVAKLGPHSVSNLQDRMERVKDDILAAVIERSQNASKSVLFTTLSTLTPKPLRQAFAGAIQRGVSVTGFTNGPRAYEDVGPWPLPWTVGLYSMKNLLDDGILLKQFSRPDPSAYYSFLHRKVALFDDSAIIFGSHNLNLPSSTNNDEISFEIESPKLNSELREIFEQEKEAGYFQSISREEVTRDSETWSALLQRMIARPIITLF